MKKILGLTIAALLVMALVGGGTWAYFSDTEQSTANVLTAGTLDLKLTDDNETDQDGVTATWTDSAFNPGSSATGTVTLKNSGTNVADHIEITFANTLANVVTPVEIEAIDDIDISDTMNITVLSYGALDLLAITAGVFDQAEIEAADAAGNADDAITLNELDGVTIDNLTEVPTPSGAATKDFDMTVVLDATTGNGNQGDGVTTVITFAINSHSSQ